MERRILWLFHGKVRDDFYFSFTTGGLTAPVLCLSFLSEIFFIPYQSTFCRVTYKTTRHESATFMRCKETKKFVLSILTIYQKNKIYVDVSQ